jgi:hypothetical protein
MAIRLRQSATIKVSSNSQTETGDLGNLSWETLTDGLGEGGTWKTLVPAATTDLEIHLDNIATVSFLALSTTAKDPTQAPVSLDFKKNDIGNEVFVVAPLTGSKQGHFMTTTSGITSLFVTNSGAVDMEVIIVIAGD